MPQREPLPVLAMECVVLDVVRRNAFVAAIGMKL
jgi:hypothetical protein